MGKGIKRTDDDFKRELLEKNPNIIPLEPYTNSKAYIKVRCKICGHVWKARANHLLEGSGCPECAKKAKTGSLELFLSRLEAIWGDLIKYVSSFEKMSAKCKVQCSICGYIWDALPHNLFKKHGCPKCGYKSNSEKQIMPLPEMLEKVKEIHGDSIIYIGGYNGTMKKCKWKCAKCGREWEATPDSIINAHSGCVVCVVSTMEKPVLEALTKKGINPKHNQPLEGCIYKADSFPLRPDFLIERPYEKLWIECDGQQHFKAIYNDKKRFQEDQERDAIKNQYAKENGYILIRVTSSPTKKWGTEKHITLKQLLKLIEIGINSETGEINFELFKQYDFNRE